MIVSKMIMDYVTELLKRQSTQPLWLRCVHAPVMTLCITYSESPSQLWTRIRGTTLTNSHMIMKIS